MADENKPYFYEFLYRGRPPDSTEPPAWQITIGAMVPDPFGGAPTHHTQTLNMEQAKVAGWDLPKILEAVNTSALAEVDKIRGEHSKLASRYTQATETIDRLENEKRELNLLLAAASARPR